MNQESTNASTTRTWRDIAQPLRPDKMSRGGRWRRRLAELRVAMVVLVVGGLGWGGWAVAGALRENSKAMPAAARAVPVKSPHVKTDGVLDDAWVARTLALPKNISLMELKLKELQARLLADGQVVTATLKRHFPDGLEVILTERTPVARVMAELGGAQHQLLVARDGTVFFGAGYEPAMLETLPWLDGVAIVRRGQQFLPVAGMSIVADLLSKARLEAEHLYRTWSVVSLARLESDREIEVRTREPHHLTIVFGALPGDERLPREGDFHKQIAKLDYLWDTFAAKPGVRGRVDLSLGRQVPVTVEEVAAPAPPRATAMAPSAATPAVTFFRFVAQPRTQREH